MTSKNKRKILYCGPLSDSSGWGESARQYVKALISQGENVQTIHFKIDNLERELSKEEKDIRVATISNNTEIESTLISHSSDGDIIIHHLMPELSIVLQDRFNVSCFSYETDKIPTNQEFLFNRMDLCLVSCNENLKAFNRSGIKTPTYLVPFAFDLDKYKKEYQPLDIKEIEDFSFKFYTICQLSHRKGLDALLKSYFSEFTGQDDVVLVLKMYINMRQDTDETQYIANIINTIKQHMKLTHFPKVFIINDRYSDEDIMRLHASCDAYVLPSRAESFSITHFEAAAMGKYPIAVGWGGPTEFIRDAKDSESIECHKQNGILIGYDLQPVVGMDHPTSYLYTSYENWAEPKISDLKSAMRDSYEYMKDEKFVEYQNMIRLKCIDDFSIENVGPKLLKVINNEYDIWTKKRKEKKQISKAKQIGAIIKTENMIEFVTCGYNCEKYVEKCINSVLEQNNGNWKMHLINDASTDNTGLIIQKTIQSLPDRFIDKFIIHTNKKNVKALKNIYDTIHNCCNDNSIIATLDMDDWLAHDNVVNLLLKEYQDPELWIAWTQMQHYPSMRLGLSAKVPNDIIDVRKYRPYGQWIFWQLRTFRKKLFMKIKKEDLLDYHKDFYKFAYDYPMTFPMLEMAGPKHRKFIDDICYIYNIETELNEGNVSVPEVVRIATEILNKQPYKEIEKL